MSLTAQTPINRRFHTDFIEWDTTRGRGSFDAGYVNEFSFCMNENGEIDEQKMKNIQENSQHRILKNRRSLSSIKKFRHYSIKIKKSAASGSQVTDKKRNRHLNTTPNQNETEKRNEKN